MAKWYLERWLLWNESRIEATDKDRNAIAFVQFYGISLSWQGLHIT